MGIGEFGSLLYDLGGLLRWLGMAKGKEHWGGEVAV